MDYKSLVNQIQSYANKTVINPTAVDADFFAKATPYFIEMGQQRIWRELTGIEFEKTITVGILATNSAFIAIPIFWNKTISFSYGTNKNYSNSFKILKPRTYEFCRAYWPSSSESNSNNPPEFYSHHINPLTQSSSFFISPPPDKNYFYELTYLTRVINIGGASGNSTNILTEEYPDLLFYACFLEALAYLRDDERIQVYEANYQRALQSAMARTQDRHIDRTINRETD